MRLLLLLTTTAAFSYAFITPRLSQQRYNILLHSTPKEKQTNVPMTTNIDEPFLSNDSESSPQSEDEILVQQMQQAALQAMQTEAVLIDAVETFRLDSATASEEVPIIAVNSIPTEDGEVMLPSEETIVPKEIISEITESLIAENDDSESLSISSSSPPDIDLPASSAVTDFLVDTTPLPNDGTNDDTPISSESDSKSPTSSSLSAQETLAVSEVLEASRQAADTALQTPAAPRVSQILKFALPATGVWLCSPLLSLIDTSSVGLWSGTWQQAALNPAVAVTDYAALLIAFLFTGSTNLMASTANDSEQAQSHFVGALQLSTYVGAALGLVLLTFTRPLLGAITGGSDLPLPVLQAATRYVRIRALGMPAAAIIGSAQAACLGRKDVKSPLMVLIVAAVVNFMGDVFLVPRQLPWLGGTAGAAWATVLSQYAAVALFCHWLTSKKDETVNLSKNILELTTDQTQSLGHVKRRQRFRKALFGKKNKSMGEAEPSVRGFLANKFRPRQLLATPPKETLDAFRPYMLPVTTTQVGRVSGYVAMAHVVASSLGTVSMAAQQVIVSLFYCLCPIADSLSLTAQSFVPAIDQAEDSPQRTSALRGTFKSFLKSGAIFGGLMMSAVACIPWLCRFFTADPVVASLVSQTAPLLMGIFMVHGWVCGMEGVLLGRRDLRFLGRAYAAFFGIVPWAMLQVKRNAEASLQNVWQVFLSYQLFRVCLFVGRAGLLPARKQR